MFLAILSFIICLHLAILLGIAGVMKGADVGRFESQLLAHRLFPAFMVGLVGRLIVTSELVVALWLLSGVTPRIALIAGVVLMGGFLSYRVWMLWRGVEDSRSEERRVG